MKYMLPVFDVNILEGRQYYMKVHTPSLSNTALTRARIPSRMAS